MSSLTTQGFIVVGGVAPALHGMAEWSIGDVLCDGCGRHAQRRGAVAERYLGKPTSCDYLDYYNSSVHAAGPGHYQCLNEIGGAPIEESIQPEVVAQLPERGPRQGH